MNTKKKLAIIVLCSFWGAVLMALTLFISSFFWRIPHYTIPGLGLTLLSISRWWDVLFLPVYIIVSLGYFLFLPYRNADVDDVAYNIEVGIITGLVFGLTVATAQATNLGFTLFLACVFILFTIFFSAGLKDRVFMPSAVVFSAGFAVGIINGCGNGFIFAGATCLILLLLFWGIWGIKAVLRFHKRILEEF